MLIEISGVKVACVFLHKETIREALGRFDGEVIRVS